MTTSRGGPPIGSKNAYTYGMDARFVMRIPSKIKSRLESAAGRAKMSNSAFVLLAISEKLSGASIERRNGIRAMASRLADLERRMAEINAISASCETGPVPRSAMLEIERISRCD